MAPPALRLRENTRSRRQGRRHDPLGRTIGGLDRQRANGSQYNADPHLQLYSCRIAPCSIRSQVVCETEAQPRQTNTTSVQYDNDILENTLFKISTGSLVLKLLCTGGQFLS